MSEIIATWLVFTHTPSRSFGDLIGILQDSGWTVPQRGDVYSFLVDNDLKEFDTVSELIETINSAVTASITVERDHTEIRVELNADTGRDPPELTNIHIRAWDSEFRPPRDGWNGRKREDATVAYLDAVRTSVETLEPNYGYGRYPEYTKMKAIPTYDDVLDGRVKGTFWLNVFGEKHIQTLGRDRIESAPAWRVEELDTGQFLVVASDNPVEPSEEWGGALDALASHLGMDRG